MSNQFRLLIFTYKTLLLSQHSNKIVFNENSKLKVILIRKISNGDYHMYYSALPRPDVVI